MNNNNVLLLDFQNFLHRARCGFDRGEFGLVYNFIRNLRSLIEVLKPSRVIMSLEGHPQWRYEMLGEYKANRIAEEGTKKFEENADLHRQKKLIIKLLQFFPVTIVKHPHHECDDTLYNIIASSPTSTQFTVVSNDTDFIQLLNEFDNVKLWNPMKKEYVVKPEYDYILWKSLRGDGSDCIPGIPGVGDKTAEKYVRDLPKLEEFFVKNPQYREQFAMNLKLIKFYRWNEDEMMQMTSNTAIKDWDAVKLVFEEYNFVSLLKEKPWAKIVSTFDTLWG